MNRAILCMAAVTVVVSGCSDAVTTLESSAEPQLAMVPVNVSAAPAITTLSITVSAADIATDLIFNLDMSGGAASDTITIPAGSSRTVTIRGFDENGIETHRGSKTVHLTEGLNPQLTIVLLGLTGELPLLVILGETNVAVTPEAVSLSVGGTAQLEAVVTDESGDTLDVAVRWGSSNPAFVTVDEAGMVSGVGLGSASVVATYGGVGAGSAVTVVEEVLPPGIAGSLAVGGWHNCMVTSAGEALCWGFNSTGQLGNGTFTSSPVPVSVVGDIRWSSLTVGGSDFSCGLSDVGRAYCWGNDRFGRFGLGYTDAAYDQPVEVSGGHAFAALESGYYFACGLDTSATVLCWGLLQGPDRTDTFIPTAVTLGSTIGRLASANDSENGGFCLLDLASSALCRAEYGLVDDFSPVPGGIEWTQLAVNDVTRCGVAADGTGYCWGENWLGQLGDGTTAPRSEPTQVLGGHVWRSIISVEEFGYAGTCGLTVEGEAYCWGSNRDGLLGIGSPADQQIDPASGVPFVAVPSPVQTDLTFVELQIGDSVDWGLGYASPTICGVTEEGHVYCWGDNLYGQVGDGTFEDRQVPTRVILPPV